MCGPLAMTAAAIGLGVAQAGMQAAGQAEYASNAANAIQSSLRNEYQQGQQQRIWHDDAASQKLAANQKQLRAAMGNLNAAAAANGVGGLSLAAMANELNANAGHYASDVEYNRKAADDEIALQLKGLQAGAQSNLNNLPEPSPLEVPLAAVGTGLSAYSTYFPQDTQRRYGAT